MTDALEAAGAARRAFEVASHRARRSFACSPNVAFAKAAAADAAASFRPDAFRISPAIEAAVGQRSSGAAASARATTGIRAFAHGAFSGTRGAGSVPDRTRRPAASVPAGESALPSSASHNKIPTLKTSVRASCASPKCTSGARYGVDAASLCTSGARRATAWRMRPTPSAPKRMVAGEISPWVSFIGCCRVSRRPCSAPAPVRTSSKIRSATSRESAPNRSAAVPPTEGQNCESFSPSMKSPNTTRSSPRDAISRTRARCGLASVVRRRASRRRSAPAAFPAFAAPAKRSATTSWPPDVASVVCRAT